MSESTAERLAELRREREVLAAAVRNVIRFRAGGPNSIDWLVGPGEIQELEDALSLLEGGGGE